MLELTQILRLVILLGWSIIIIWSFPAYERVLTYYGPRAKLIRPNDFRHIAFSIVGFGLVGFQFLAMLPRPHKQPDYWNVVCLGLLAASAALVIFLVHLPQTPVGHKRALVWTHLGLLGGCIIGGIIG